MNTHEREPERDGDAGAEVEVGEADADRDELGDQRDEVRQAQVARAEPAPDAPVALQHELAVAAVRDRADAHRTSPAPTYAIANSTGISGTNNPSPYCAPSEA